MKKYSFGKADRIRKRIDFLMLSKNCNKVRNQHFIALIRPNFNNRTRLGITVSKRVGNAVVRNRIKRIIREYFRLNRHCLNQFWDINIIAQKQVAKIDNAKVFASLKTIFSKISTYEKVI